MENRLRPAQGIRQRYRSACLDVEIVYINTQIYTESAPMIFAHKIVLDLTHDQERYCRQAAGTARLTYNWALAEWIRQYHAGEKPTALQLKKQWNAMKYERYPWLADIHRDAHAQPFANLQKAFATFFQNLNDR